MGINDLLAAKGLVPLPVSALALARAVVERAAGFFARPALQKLAASRAAVQARAPNKVNHIEPGIAIPRHVHVRVDRSKLAIAVDQPHSTYPANEEQKYVACEFAVDACDHPILITQLIDD